MKKLILLSFLLLLFLPTIAQWEIQDHFPEGTYLSDVYFVNDNVGWVVGYEGSIFKTSDAGQSWLDQSINLANLYFFDVFFIDEDNGWIVGHYSVHLGGYWGIIYRTNDGGENWNEQLHQGGYDAITGVFFNDTLNGVAVVSGWPGILNTNDGGDEWTVYPSNYYSLRSVFFINDTLGWIGGWGSIYQTNDGGANWNIQSPFPIIDIIDVYFIDENIGWAVGELLNNETGIIYKTLNGGNTWNETEMFEKSLNGVFFVNPNYGWVVGDYGNIRYTTDGGETWNNQSVDSSRLVSINITDEHQGWITGGQLYHADLSNIVGIKKYQNQFLNNVNVHPNPSSTSTTFSFNLNQPLSVQITIYNHFGEKIDVVRQEQTSGQQKVIWDATGLPSGIYFYRVHVGDKIASGKLVIFR